MKRKEVQDKIKKLCEEFKEQSWNVFRHYYNELNDLVEKLNDKDIKDKDLK